MNHSNGPAYGQFVSGDIIKMVLDKTLGELTLFLNEKLQTKITHEHLRDPHREFFPELNIYDIGHGMSLKSVRIQRPKKEQKIEMF